jgi:hypothetical protein
MSQKLHRHGDWRENLKESEPEGAGNLNPASASARATSVTAAALDSDTSSLVDTKSGQDSESIMQLPLEQSTSDKETNTASGNFNLKLQLRRRYSLTPGTQSASGVRPVLSIRVPDCQCCSGCSSWLSSRAVTTGISSPQHSPVKLAYSGAPSASSSCLRQHQLGALESAKPEDCSLNLKPGLSTLPVAARGGTKIMAVMPLAVDSPGAATRDVAHHNLTPSRSLSTSSLLVQASFFALVALVFLSGDQQLTATFLGDHWLPSGSGCCQWCANAAVSPGERQGLVNLYLATDGPNWQGVTGWSNYADPAADPCSWTGVNCDGSSIRYVSDCRCGSVLCMIVGKLALALGVSVHRRWAQSNKWAIFGVGLSLPGGFTVVLLTAVTGARGV